MKTEYTHKQKIAYYKNRASDMSLKPSQRLFAQGFIDGANDTPYAYKRDTLEFIQIEIPRMETENKVFVNPTFNGYGQGSLSALKDIVARREQRGENDG
jgi:hypothetical protein